jgi:hypothetical protein
MGAVAAASAAWAVWTVDRPWRTPPASTLEESLRYVDHDGWMLTPEDQRRLAARATGALGR